jgi:hypothetical protein
MPSKRVTIHYRRIVDRNLADLDFLACFQAGLNGQVGGIRLRDSDSIRITLSADRKRMCLLSPIADPNFCFGEVAVFKEGDVPIATTDDGGQVHLRRIELEGNEEAIRGTSYFMARGPHLAILHHDSQTRFLADYFGWLFRQPIGDLPQEEMVSLQPLISVAGQPVALREVKSLKIRAEVEIPQVGMHAVPDGRVQTFRRMIDRQQLDQSAIRTILHAMGMSNGSVRQIPDAEIENLEFELLITKKERNRLQPLPNEIIEGVVADGLDRAAEFHADGVRRRGDVVVASYPAEVEFDGTYYDENSVRTVLWAALGSWANQGLI